MNITSEEFDYTVQKMFELGEAKKIIQQVIEQATPIGNQQSLVVAIPRATLDAAVQFTKDYVK